MATSANIPALFGAVAAKVHNVLSTRATDPFAIYYDYGRYLEITRRLTEKGKGITDKTRRFPLIWLVIPFKETYGNTGEVCELTDLQIIIATQTEPDSTTPDRMVDTFTPRLFPIYDELIKQIKNSGFFSEIGYDVPHVKINQPYWDGKESGNSAANMFNEFIDAIQLKGIRLTVNETTCDRFRLIAGAA
jgi:hypothetical protein